MLKKINTMGKIKTLDNYTKKTLSLPPDESINN